MLTSYFKNRCTAASPGRGRSLHSLKQLSVHGPASRGSSLVELMVGLAVVAVLLSLGLPSFTSWIQNSQIRAAAESIQNGLQLARAEAVRRNNTVRFQLTTTADNTCAVSTAGRNWVVSQDDPSGACASAASDTVPPRIIQVRSAAEGSANAVIAPTEVLPTGVAGGALFTGTVIFNGMGRVNTTGVNATIDPGNNASYLVGNILDNCLACAAGSTWGDCPAAPGQMRCLRVVVSTGGQIRMCDPALANTTPLGC